ncbi:MAG TPA: hypothetical protein VF300_01715 [Methanothrix sp.]
MHWAKMRENTIYNRKLCELKKFWVLELMSIKAAILIALVLFIATSQGTTLKEKEVDGLSRGIAVSTFFEGIRDNPEELRAFFFIHA